MYVVHNHQLLLRTPSLECLRFASLNSPPGLASCAYAVWVRFCVKTSANLWLHFDHSKTQQTYPPSAPAAGETVKLSFSSSLALFRFATPLRSLSASLGTCTLVPNLLTLARYRSVPLLGRLFSATIRSQKSGNNQSMSSLRTRQQHHGVTYSSISLSPLSGLISRSRRRMLSMFWHLFEQSSARFRTTHGF